MRNKTFSPLLIFLLLFFIQRLTYEEKMARRLLGADSAATVFSIQEPEEDPAVQVPHNCNFIGKKVLLSIFLLHRL